LHGTRQTSTRSPNSGLEHDVSRSSHYLERVRAASSQSAFQCAGFIDTCHRLKSTDLQQDYKRLRANEHASLARDEQRLAIESELLGLLALVAAETA